MNIAFKYPIIFWNTACLITDSGGSEEGSEGSNNYDKIAKALNKTKAAGINIALPDINKSQYTYEPNIEENKIYIGLRGLLNVGEDVIALIQKNRPYINFADFLNKNNFNKQAVISLIKSGAFDSFDERKRIMAQYIWKTCDKKARLNLQNMATLMKRNMIPDELTFEKSVYEFNRYLKDVCGKQDSDYFILDTRAINFLAKNFSSLLSGDKLSKKVWDKTYQKVMDKVRAYIHDNHDEMLYQLNKVTFYDDWLKYAKGSYSAWEMEASCYYYHEHELAHVNMRKYNLSDFYSLPEEPIPKSFYRGTIPLYNLTYICGTVIAKDKPKSSISFLTTEGVVHIRFRKEYFALFDKQISQRGEDGKKKVLEKSWFNRGSMLMISGIRRGDDFVPKKYSSSVGHAMYKITEVKDNGDLVLQYERAKGESEEED